MSSLLPYTDPEWLLDLLGLSSTDTEGPFTASGGARLLRRDGLLRAVQTISDAQAQTKEAFGFKWHKRDTFDSEISLSRMKEWLVQRYGEVSTSSWWDDYGPQPLVVDAGCGAGMSALELFGAKLATIRYLGVDISNAVDVARERFRERGFNAAFLQADITQLPLPQASVDVIFSEGVLHHTSSTERALKSLCPLLKPGGRILFYVYRKKGPIREFTDDYIRAELKRMPPEIAWEAMQPLTKLGKALGELNAEVNVPEDIPLLGIPAGPISIQRLFYWYVFKAYHDPSLSEDELNHINYDWYAPEYAHRQSPEEVRQWCKEAGLEIEREDVQLSGITIVGRKTP